MAVKKQAKPSRSSSASRRRSPISPADALLERVPNPHPETLYAARFTAPEFTCLCPITGQPDFAHLVIDYAPKRWLLESKSLKLYLASFRNFGDVPRRCDRHHRQAHRRSDRACVFAHRRLLVSARRHPHRRVLAVRHACQRGCGCRTRASRPIAGGARRSFFTKRSIAISSASRATAALSAAPCWARRRARGPGLDGSR